MVGADIKEFGKSIEAAASRLGESIDHAASRIDHASQLFSMSIFLCGVMAFAPHELVTWIVISIPIITAMIVVLMPAVRRKILCKILCGPDNSRVGSGRVC